MKNWYKEIEDHLHSTLERHLPNNRLAEAMLYSTFPAGKFFRSSLVYAVAHDLKSFTRDHRVLASSIELHHTYTLIHDDLPAMDDDDIRRGRPSVHKKFNEWLAILAGDALMGISFSNLSQIDSSKLPWLLKFFGFCTTSKGLILGQSLDMDGVASKNLKSLLRTHELKTSRLIQLAITGSAHLSSQISLDQYKDFMQLGNCIGVCFQLIDDYQELSSPLGEHEKEINPFLKYGHEEVSNIIVKNQNKAKQLCQKHHLNHVGTILTTYFNKFELKATSDFPQ